MNPQTNTLVNTNLLKFNLDSLPTLNNKTASVNNLKLRFNKESLLSLYIEITGFNNKNHIGKTFSIEKSPNKKDVFFQKLFNLINKENSISLIKNTHLNESVFWTRSNFKIESDTKITFKVLEELTPQKTTKLNKLLQILNSLESKLNKNISEKYLNGYLEERGITTFKEYVNS